MYPFSSVLCPLSFLTTRIFSLLFRCSFSSVALPLLPSPLSLVLSLRSHSYFSPLLSSLPSLLSLLPLIYFISCHLSCPSPLSSGRGAQETDAALAASRDAVAYADLARQQAEDQEAAAKDLLSTVRDEAAARDASALLEQGELREAVAKQTDALRKALSEGSLLKGACAAAEANAALKEEARCKAVEDATKVEERLRDALEDLKLAQEETGSLQESLAQARAACEASQEDVRRQGQARFDAENSLRQHSERLAELERLLKETQARSSEVEGELEKSLQQVGELSQAADGYREEIAAAGANLEQLKTLAARQDANLRASLSRGDELEDALQAARSQVEGEHTAADTNRLSVPASTNVI